MNNRGTYVMLGVVGAVLLALGVVAIRKGKASSASGQVLASLNAAQIKGADITGLELEFAGGPTLSFFREDSQTPWKMTKPIATRVSGTEIDEQHLILVMVDPVADLPAQLHELALIQLADEHAVLDMVAMIEQGPMDLGPTLVLDDVIGHQEAVPAHRVVIPW